MTRRAILEAARKTMLREGFAATTMEAVARRADVSVGSLYNYFDSKRALLLGVLTEATSSVVEQATAMVEDPGDDARAAVFGLMHLYAESLQRLDRDLLRHALGVSFTEPADVGAEMFRLDEMLMRQTATLVEDLQGRGLLTKEVSTEQATLTLYGTFVVAMLMWIAMPQADDAALLQSLDGQLAVVFRGLQPSRGEQEARR